MTQETRRLPLAEFILQVEGLRDAADLLNGQKERHSEYRARSRGYADGYQIGLSHLKRGEPLAKVVSHLTFLRDRAAAEARLLFKRGREVTEEQRAYWDGVASVYGFFVVMEPYVQSSD